MAVTIHPNREAQWNRSLVASTKIRLLQNKREKQTASMQHWRAVSENGEGFYDLIAFLAQGESKMWVNCNCLGFVHQRHCKHSAALATLLDSLGMEIELT